MSLQKEHDAEHHQHPLQSAASTSAQLRPGGAAALMEMGRLNPEAAHVGVLGGGVHLVNLGVSVGGWLGMGLWVGCIKKAGILV